jgi:hypothetical protein
LALERRRRRTADAKLSDLEQRLRKAAAEGRPGLRAPDDDSSAGSG